MSEINRYAAQKEIWLFETFWKYFNICMRDPTETKLADKFFIVIMGLSRILYWAWSIKAFYQGI